METSHVISPGTASLRRHWIVFVYFAALVAAEILVAFADPVSREPTVQGWGLSLHILLVFALTFHAVLAFDRDPRLAYLFTALSLASLVRVFSLSVPRFTFDVVQWLALISVPLLVSVAAVAYVQRLGPRSLGLGLGSWRNLPIQAGIAATGVPLGLIEFYILRPEPWIPVLELGAILVGSVVIFFGTGISEELIFRGIMLRRAVEGLGPRAGLLFVSSVFASLHIGFRSPVDLAFVFLVGLSYGIVVLKTKSLWGVALSHSLGNVVLYLIAPHVLA